MIDGVVLHRSAKAKRIALRLDSKNQCVRLVMPKRGSERKAWDFALANEGWIKQRLETLPKPVAFEAGAIIPVFGQDRLVVQHQGAGRLPVFTLHDHELHVATNRTEFAGSLKRWLIKQVEEKIAELVAQKCAALQVQMQKPLPPVKISIRDQKSRWGSCSHEGTLCFSWRLVLAPPVVLDYVVAHEVAHLKHLDHSPNFWAVCQSLAENQTVAKHWLNLHGTSLGRYGG